MRASTDLHESKNAFLSPTFSCRYYWLKHQSWAFTHYMMHAGRGSGDTLSGWTNRTVDECIAEGRPNCRQRRMEYRAEMNIVRKHNAAKKNRGMGDNVGIYLKKKSRPICAELSLSATS